MTDVLIIAGPSIVLVVVCVPTFFWIHRRERQERRDGIAGKRR
ncbi:MAG TPA: hypothetical protein VM204_09205 [Gaiellaceae bacterium]|nr:hypothetical protein [Gaiellaceae bacterium]